MWNQNTNPLVDFMRWLLAAVRINLRASLAAGRSFWMQLVFMMANNLIFWVIWFIFFTRYRDIRGWTFAEVTLMYGMVQVAWGLNVTLFGGLRTLAKAIVDGDMDVWLLQPRPVVMTAAFSRSQASGWGDVVTGVALCVYSGYLDLTEPWRAFGVIVGCIGSAAVFAAAGLAFHSLAFWLGPVNTLARQLTEYLIMLSCYPQTAYTGVLRLVVYSVIPAAMAGFLPVELVRSGAILPFLAGTLAVVAVGLSVFHIGLKRYSTAN